MKPGIVANVVGAATALSMTVGRGTAARVVAGQARITAADVVVDVGCGPGAAVREAARRGASAIGVDPDQASLRLARWLTALRGTRNVSFVEGTAERLPLPDGIATVVWALSSLHHWADRGAAFQEIQRVLRPGGRVLLAERLVKPGARGHAAHGLTEQQVQDVAAEMATAGFHDTHWELRSAGRRTLVILMAVSSHPAGTRHELPGATSAAVPVAPRSTV